MFELSAHDGTFEQRTDKLKTLARNIIEPVEQQRFTSNDELRVNLTQVVDASGECQMLHCADAPLASDRSDLLLKRMPLVDAETVVVGQEPGKGRDVGQAGAPEQQTPEGVQVTGFTDAQRRDPPPTAHRRGGRLSQPLSRPVR